MDPLRHLREGTWGQVVYPLEATEVVAAVVSKMRVEARDLFVMVGASWISAP